MAAGDLNRRICVSAPDGTACPSPRRPLRASPPHILTFVQGGLRRLDPRPFREDVRREAEIVRARDAVFELSAMAASEFHYDTLHRKLKDGIPCPDDFSFPSHVLSCGAGKRGVADGVMDKQCRLAQRHRSFGSGQESLVVTDGR
jgi:hypothetical protein